MKKLQKVLGAAKRRISTKRTNFELNEDRLRIAEKTLGSKAGNVELRKQLADMFDHQQGIQSLWEQAPSASAIQDESAKVLKRLKKGADLLRVLNEHQYAGRITYEATYGDSESTREALRKIKLNSGISEELLSLLRHHGVDSDAPILENTVLALTKIKNAPRAKTGRPEEYPRDGYLLQLMEIYRDQTGKEATYSSNTGRSRGPFIDLCRAMMISHIDFMSCDALSIEQALKRLKKSIK